MKKQTLTTKQKLFVSEYLVDRNAKQAAIRAGYSAKTAEVQGSRLLSNVKVKELVGKKIAKLEENFVKHEAEGGSNINLQHGNSGKTDGLTQFVWEAASMYDVPRFKHAPFAHVYPSIGKIAVFPIWMLHQVSPFYGEGERRTMSCNIDIINHH